MKFYMKAEKVKMIKLVILMIWMVHENELIFNKFILIILKALTLMKVQILNSEIKKQGFNFDYYDMSIKFSKFYYI